MSLTSNTMQLGFAMFHPKGPTFFELARQCLSSTERGYDLLAPKFDYTPFRTPDWILNTVARQLQRYGPFDTLLDICCGTGAAMQTLLPQCRNRMVGIDMSQGMLDVAKSKLDSYSTTARIELIRGNVLEMPFDAEFDLAVSFGAFGHILRKDESQLVREIARTLKPGGIFAFVTSAMPPIWTTSYWVCRGFNAAMRMRNLLINPPFVMYYLTFLLPEVEELLNENGLMFQVERPFAARHRRLRLIIATRH